MNQKTANEPQIFAVRLDAHKVAPPTREWKPLKHYALPRADERKQYASLPSQYQ